MEKKKLVSLANQTSCSTVRRLISTKKLFITVAVMISMLLMATVPGYAMESLASWSQVGGPSWSQARTPAEGNLNYVASLLYINGSLYAGTGDGVWSWSGSSWSEVRGPEYPKSNWEESINVVTLADEGPVVNLAAIGGALYAGTGNRTGGGLWSWNGSFWSPLGGTGGLPESAVYIQSLDGMLYATSFNSVWSWNGSSWSQVGGSGALTGLPAYVNALAAINGTLFAGTSDGIYSIPIPESQPNTVEFIVGSDQYTAE
jgi:hypothetical protein